MNRMLKEKDKESKTMEKLVLTEAEIAHVTGLLRADPKAASQALMSFCKLSTLP